MLVFVFVYLWLLPHPGRKGHWSYGCRKKNWIDCEIVLCALCLYLCLQTQTITAASYPIVECARAKGGLIARVSLIDYMTFCLSLYLCVCSWCLQTQTITAASYPILGHARVKGALIARASSLIQTPPWPVVIITVTRWLLHCMSRLETVIRHCRTNCWFCHKLLSLMVNGRRPHICHIYHKLHVE